MALTHELAVVRDLAADLHAHGRDEQARALEAVLDLAASALVGHSSSVRSREYLTTSQAAATLGVTRQTIKNWVQAGRLRGVELGGRTLLHRDEVQAQLDRLLSARPRATQASAPSEDAVRADYEALLQAVPPDSLQRLEQLHTRLEQGLPLSRQERSEMVTLERQVTRAATEAFAMRLRPRSLS